VALCGHNRGSHPFFSFVKNLKIGDELTYTTKYGTRTYEVYYKAQISETDYTGLSWSGDKMLTLITCIENTPELRWLVQAREI
jgi:sortase A